MWLSGWERELSALLRFWLPSEKAPDSTWCREAPQPKQVTRGFEKPPVQSLFKSGSRIVQGLPADIGGSSVPTRKRRRKNRISGALRTQPKSKRKPKSPTGQVSARPNMTHGARTESGGGKSRNDTSGVAKPSFREQALDGSRDFSRYRENGRFGSHSGFDGMDDESTP